MRGSDTARLRWWPFWLVVLVVWLWAVGNRPGTAVGDSPAYLDVAARLAAGDGLTASFVPSTYGWDPGRVAAGGTEVPVTLAPPGYALALALPLGLGASDQTAVWLVNLAAFAATAAGVARLSRVVAADRAPIVASGAVVWGVAASGGGAVWATALSEPLTGAIAVWVVALAVAPAPTPSSPSRRFRPLAALGVMVGLTIGATSVRYIGVALAVGVFAAAWQWFPRSRAWLPAAGVAASALPLAIWLATRGEGRETAWGVPKGGARGVVDELVGSFASLSVPRFAAVVAVAVGVAGVVVAARSARSVAVVGLGVWAAAAAMLAATGLALDRQVWFGNRFLVPFRWPILVLAAGGVCSLVKMRGGVRVVGLAGGTVVAVVALFGLEQLGVIHSNVTAVEDALSGFDRAVERRLTPGSIVFTPQPGRLGRAWDVPVGPLPSEVDSTTLDANPLFEEQMDQLTELAGRRAVFVVVDSLTPSLVPAAVDEVEARPHKVVLRDRAGVAYLMLPR